MCALTFQKLVDSRKVHVHLIFLFLFLNCQADSKNAIKNSFISLDPVERFQAKFGNWFSPLKNLALHLFQGLRWYYRYYYFFFKMNTCGEFSFTKVDQFSLPQYFSNITHLFLFWQSAKKRRLLLLYSITLIWWCTINARNNSICLKMYCTYMYPTINCICIQKCDVAKYMIL